MQAQLTNSTPFISGEGEMSALTRNFDWTNSPLGNIKSWHQSLRTLVSMILAAKSPMFLWWGSELIQFYNDAYRPSFGNQGKHPIALGQRGEECWPEIWPTIKPLIDQVLAGGESIWSENQLIPIYRNGKLEDVYWTFSYSPVNDDFECIAGVFVSCIETTREVKSHLALVESQKRFQNLVIQAPVAIALFRGPQFVVELANERVLEYWGRSLEQVLNKPLFEALPEVIGQGYDELLTNVLTTGNSFIAKELSVDLLRNGQMEKTYIDFVYEPYYEDDQTVQGVMVVANEITGQVVSRQQVEYQVEQRTQELAHAIDDLRQSNNNLQQFAYVASHDLQEPLRKVQQFGDLLRTQYTDQLGEGLDYLTRIQSATSRMSTLIKDLLTFARISTKPEATELVSLPRVIEEVLTDLEVVIQETDAVITIGLLPSIQGDRSQLGQLFQNLLSNSLKFRQTDTFPRISINAKTLASTELPLSIKPTRLSANYHRIDVVDNGIGFDEKYIDRIFQVFQRLHNKNQYAGTGIGLAICEKVAINHGGIITVRSQPNQGAIFSVYLPI